MRSSASRRASEDSRSGKQNAGLSEPFAIGAGELCEGNPPISTDAEIENIKKHVPQALDEVAHLLIAKDGEDRPVAFMGIEDGTLEMLFVSAEERGKGFGKRLIEYRIENHAVIRLAVNEQNPKAKGFYEHIGFRAYKRTDLDEQGNPYPLLYMKLSHAD